VILLYNPLPLKYNKEIASLRLQYQKSNIKNQNDNSKGKNTFILKLCSVILHFDF